MQERPEFGKEEKDAYNDRAHSSEQHHSVRNILRYPRQRMLVLCHEVYQRLYHRVYHLGGHDKGDYGG